MKFRCQRDIVSAEGCQEFEVEADSESAAYLMFAQGKGELVHTECEVTHLSEYDLETIYLSGNGTGADWPESEERIDIIGSNGNDGYE